MHSDRKTAMREIELAQRRYYLLCIVAVWCAFVALQVCAAAGCGDNIKPPLPSCADLGCTSAFCTPTGRCGCHGEACALELDAGAR